MLRIIASGEREDPPPPRPTQPEEPLLPVRLPSDAMRGCVPMARVSWHGTVIAALALGLADPANRRR
jgi:hypothetical protein